MPKEIVVQNVSFSYTDEIYALKDISFTVKRGIFLGITGINGSGKSTLTYLFNGLIPHYKKGKLEGRIMVDGVDTISKPVGFFARKIGMVFQNPDFSLFNLTVREEIAFGLKNLNLKNQELKIREALKKVGVESLIDRDPHSLSLGEKQKVCLAAVLALDVDYIVLDEPTAMLDYKSSEELYKVLKELNMEGKTIITVEHDTDLLLSFTDETLILHEGKIALLGKTADVLSRQEILKKLGIKLPHKNNA